MKSFIPTDPNALVQEGLQGIVATSPHLALLDGFPKSIHVVVDTQFDGDERVAIISGGGSGHEPAFAGYVGEGMLAAAVAGDVFASPSEDAVYAAIRHVTGSKGCVVIIMNYTGDRLQFGAAVERAKAVGLSVRLVVIADDCALPNSTRIGRRGIAGTVLVLKCAGAAALEGADLDSVEEVALQVAGKIGTVGCSLSVSHIPGRNSAERLGDDEIEIGLGIHGEPGVETSHLKPAEIIVRDLISRIAICIPEDSKDISKVESDSNFVSSSHYSLSFRRNEDRVVLMVNNLGGTSLLELQMLAHQAISTLRKYLDGVPLERVYLGTFMTSFSMHGFSITLLRIPRGLDGDVMLKRLDASTSALAWSKQQVEHPLNVRFLPLPEDLSSTASGIIEPSPNRLSNDDLDLIHRCIKEMCKALILAQRDLDNLDAAVGDGDCGSTFAKGAEGILRTLEEQSFKSLTDCYSISYRLSKAIEESMGGTSGALIKMFFMAAASRLRSWFDESCDTKVTHHAMYAALKSGTEAIMTYGGAKQGDRTMVDALLPAVEAMKDAIERGESSSSAIASAVATRAMEGAQATSNMIARAGRSSYIPESTLKGNPDPGAMALAISLRAVANELQQ